MHTFHRLGLVAFLLAFAAQSAHAAPKRKKKKPTKPAIPSLCESTGLSTKRCYIKGDSAELHLNISPAYPLIVSLDELPSFTYNDPYIAHQVTEGFVLFKLRKDKLPKNHNIILRTETMTLTLYFHVAKKGGDSQVHIQRSDQANQDRAVQERVAKREAELEKEHMQLLASLDERAAGMARKQLLDQVHLHGSHMGTPSGEVRARNDFLVLRATRVIRIGKERVLRVTLEERKGEPFSIGALTATVTQGGAQRSLDVDFRCSQMRILPGNTSNCTLSLGSIDKKKGRAIVGLKITGADNKRGVGLASVNIL